MTNIRCPSCQGRELSEQGYATVVGTAMYLRECETCDCEFAVDRDYGVNDE